MGSPYQLSTSFGRPQKFRSLFGDKFELKIDHKLQAEMNALRFRMELSRIRAHWLSPDWAALDDLLTRPPAPPLPPPSGSFPTLPPIPKTKPNYTFPRGKGPAVHRKAVTSDVLKALWALPIVQYNFDRVKSEAERQWSKLSTGEAVLLIGHGVLLGSGIVAGIASDDAARLWVLDKLSGVDVPIPKVDGLSFRLYSPKGLISGAGATYSHDLLKINAEGQIKPLPNGVKYNELKFNITLDVLEAIPPLKKYF